MPEEITTAELLRMAVEDYALDLHVALPAKVEAYNAAKQTCEVTPQINRMLPDGNGNYVSEPRPKLIDVPVVFPRSQAFALTYPLSAGDYVLLVFNSQAISRWRALGSQCDPGDLGMHRLDGAVAVPGFFPDALPSPNASASVMKIGSESNGDGRVCFPGLTIQLGDGASDPVALKSDLTTLYTALTTSAVVAGDGGAAYRANIKTYLDAHNFPVSSSNARAK